MLDQNGFVFGKPALVDIDLVIRDGRVILIEIKSSISIADVAIFARTQGRRSSMKAPRELGHQG
jgi:hypothetical protein